jgi:YD repeat-containing protein
VASNAPSIVANQVSVSVGGSNTASGNDPTSVGAPATGTMMDMSYRYTAGQNNGRITQAYDGVLNQTTNYTYDALNRLSTASIVETGIGEQMSYDGFGNLTGMNGTDPGVDVGHRLVVRW